MAESEYLQIRYTMTSDGKIRSVTTEILPNEVEKRTASRYKSSIVLRKVDKEDGYICDTTNCKRSAEISFSIHGIVGTLYLCSFHRYICYE